MRVSRSFAIIVSLAAVVCATTARALINPNYTPLHLVQESALIVSLGLKQGSTKDQYVGTIREVLKGKTDLKAFRFDLAQANDAKDADALRNLAAAEETALFFMGDFSNDKSGPDAARAHCGLLHVHGQWAECRGNQDGVWGFRSIDRHSLGIWAGGTDMLRRAIDYILHDDDPDVPVADGVSWSSDPKKIAAFDGKIRAVRPVDLAGDGRLVLFVARDQGDHLLSCDPKSRSFSDITAARGLQSKSQAFAWGDFSGDGRLDLLSFDGHALVLHAQQADGVFRPRALDLAAVLENGCVGLTAIDLGRKTCGLLISTRSWPVLVAFDAGGKATISTLTADGVDLQKLGRAGICLAADFFDNGTVDILQPFAEGSIMFRGQGAGRFAAGVACTVKLGAGDGAECLGDFDADGRLDVLTVSADSVRIWQNEGAGKFSETLGFSGEIAYIAKPGGIDCMVGDVNNDGRQDALIAYGGAYPLLFFNRGFRTFGHAHGLDLAEHQTLPAAEQGQQSACLGDLDGDGAQDMVLALTNGEIWVLFRQNEDNEALSLTVSLSAGSATKGPIKVTGWNGKRCLGAWNVAATNPAFFGRREAGPITVKWKLPGGQEQQKQFVLENQPVRFQIR